MYTAVCAACGCGLWLEFASGQGLNFEAIHRLLKATQLILYSGESICYLVSKFASH